MNRLSEKIINLLLRCATVGARFVFIFFLAKYLDPASVGYYGIFTATISYAIFFVGLDFYTYVSREIIKIPPSQRGRLLKGQAAVSGLVYIIGLPCAFFLLQKSNWPDHLLLWFVPILILEHLNQEVSRLLTALSEQLTSSVILFVRQGSWSLAAIGVMSVDSSARNLGTIIPLWVMAGVAALSIGVWKLKQLKTQGWNLPIDWSWIKKGIGVSAAFLLASLALRGLQTFDRYWLEDLGGIQMVGSYVLMQGIASVLMIFLEATLFAFAFPKLINLNYEGRSQEAQQQVRQMLFQTVLVAILFSIISWLLLPYFLKWIGNPIYIQALPLYPWVLSAAVINTLSMVPNLALYARGRDKPIIYSNVCALIVFVAVTWLLSGTQGSLAVIFGVNTAFFCILSWQSIAYLLLVKQENSIRK